MVPKPIKMMDFRPENQDEQVNPNKDRQKLNKMNNMNLNQKWASKHKTASRPIKTMDFQPKNQGEWINPDNDSQKLGKTKNINLD